MIKLPVYNQKGEKIDEVSVATHEKSLKFNDKLVSQVLRVEENRTGDKPGKSKTRAEVSGGGKKPWKQKGTGRARAGSIRSPLFKGGGVTFGPSGMTRELKIPAKMKRAAFEMLLAEKAKNKEAIVLDQTEIQDGKTKSAANVLKNLKIVKKALLIDEGNEPQKVRAWRNLNQVETIRLSDLRLSYFIQNNILIISRKSVEKISKSEK